jgi:outer membrane receptor for ferrienterochelin and colicins
MQEETDEVYRDAQGIKNSHEANDRREYALSYQYEKEGRSAFLRAAQSIYHKDTEWHLASNPNVWGFGIARRTIPTFEGRITRPAGEDHLITFGAEYRPETFRGTSVATGEGAFTVTRNGKTISGSKAAIDYTAAFVQDEWQVSPKLLAVTSLRYDDSNRFESNFSPKLGLTYKAEDDVRVKFNIGQGFRSPTPNQLYINTPTLIGDKNLESEESDFYEVSLEKDFGQGTSKLTYFDNKVTNLIDKVLLSGSQYQYQNIGKATLAGVEMEVSYPLNDKLSWSGSYAYLEAVDDTKDTRLTNRPRHKVAAHVKYAADTGWKTDLWTELYSDYLVPSYANNSVKLNKSFALWNVQLEKTVGKDTQIIIGIDNLFDKNDEDMPLIGRYVHGSVQFKM